MVIKKVTLYGVNTSCPCGCVNSTYVFLDREEAEILGKSITSKHSTRSIRLVEFFDCEDLEDGRYIYEDEILRIGSNEKNVDGDRILKFFNL